MQSRNDQLKQNNTQLEELVREATRLHNLAKSLPSNASRAERDHAKTELRNARKAVQEKAAAIAAQRAEMEADAAASKAQLESVSERGERRDRDRSRSRKRSHASEEEAQGRSTTEEASSSSGRRQSETATTETPETAAKTAAPSGITISNNSYY